MDPLSDLYAVLEGSALVPFLESKLQVRGRSRKARKGYIDEVLHVLLQASSFLEIGRHSAVYRVILGIIREMSGQNCLVSSGFPVCPSFLYFFCSCWLLCSIPCT